MFMISELCCLASTVLTNTHVHGLCTILPLPGGLDNVSSSLM